jgi:hypothetical protein
MTCQICELYKLVDRWMDESKIGQAFDNSEDTNLTLQECAEELAATLPPRAHVFHAERQAS